MRCLQTAASQNLRRACAQHPTSGGWCSDPHRDQARGSPEERVVDDVSVGLDVAGEALEHLAHGRARIASAERFPRKTRDRDRRARRRKWPLRQGCRVPSPRGVKLDRDTRRIGRQAEARGEGFVARSVSTIAPSVPPASSAYRHIVPRSMGTPSRANFSARGDRRQSHHVLRDEDVRDHRRKPAAGGGESSLGKRRGDDLRAHGRRLTGCCGRLDALGGLAAA